jgi:transcriptional regulator with XRE-family HTH domain
MHLQETKQKAIDLRKQGYSYNYIAKFVPVAKSTLSDWLTKIPFTPNQHTIETIGKALAVSGAKKHAIKLETLNRAKLQAEKDIGEISKRDLFMLGLAIYIGEGGKSFDITRVINADPRIIRLSIKWFMEICGVKIEQIKIRLFIYPDNDETECIEYWSNFTKIPKNQFYTSIIDRRENKKENKKGKLPFGTAHLAVRSLGDKKFGVNLHRLILAWIERVLC